MGDDGDGPGGVRMDPVLGDLRDAGRDVPKAYGDGAPSRIHRVNGNSGGIQEGLDLRLQVREKKRLEQKLWRK